MSVTLEAYSRFGNFPVRGTEKSAGADLHATEDLIILPGEMKFMDTGLTLRVKGLDNPYVYQVYPRSSLGKRGLMLANTVGIIDQDYEGPQDSWGLMLTNWSKEPLKIKKGDRIGQFIIQEIIIPDEQKNIEGAPEDGETRGGFGSTDK